MLAVWAVVVGLLAIQGLGIGDRLKPIDIYLDGTPSSRANELALEGFGDEDALVVMLRGPRAALERQGRLLDRRLDAVPGSRVLSPWRPQAIDGLRPARGVAALLVSVRHDAAERNVTAIVPPVRAVVDATVRPPVRVDMTGPPQIISSFRSAAEKATKMGELVAVPVMLVILLLVFRSLLAAAIPVVVGGAVVGAGRGVLDLLDGPMQVEAFSVSVLAMMGLALGVDYALLVVSRFREELRGGGEVAAAVERTVATTGRTVISAGTGLALTMLVAIPLLPGPVIASIAVAVITASVLSVLSALFVVPAILTLLGPSLDRWSLPARGSREGSAARLSQRVIRRPLLVTVPVVLLLLLGTGHAFALDSGIVTSGLLPPDDDGRRQQEAIERELGLGWSAPFEVVVDGGDQPVTTRSRLRALAAFERRIERDPGVDATAGFVPLERQTRGIDGLGRSLKSSGRDLARLDRGLGRARRGAQALSTGAVALHAATGETTLGARRLVEGLEAAASGSARLAEGVERTDAGGERLAQGARRASDGATRLSDGLRKARDSAGSLSTNARVLRNDLTTGRDHLLALRAPVGDTERQLGLAWQALQEMTSGRGDPRFEAAVAAVGAARRELTGVDPVSGARVDPDFAGVADGIDDAEGQFDLGLYLTARMQRQGATAGRDTDRLVRGGAQLDAGVARLADASAQISDGLGRLAAAGVRLPEGLAALTRGSDSLAGGLEQVQRGAGRLTGGLGGAAGEPRRQGLTGGLGRIEAGVERQRRASDLDGLTERSPGIFDSGYLYLAGIDGTPAAQRSQAGYVVGLDRGGRIARMQVIPTHGPLDGETRELRERLTGYSDDLAERTGAEVVVGGPTATVLDYDQALRDAFPLAILLLSFVTVLTLVPVVRSLTLPILSALLNVVTVGAAIGLMALLFDDSLLGGPGYVDTGSVAGLVMVIFGLSIDYEVFVLARMREEYDRTGSLDAAVSDGLRHTARLVTGAAVIMIAVFVSFSFSPFASVRNFGVGLAIAVFIDAFVVRLFVLPALMRAMGRWCWWTPGWLERMLQRDRPTPATQT